MQHSTPQPDLVAALRQLQSALTEGLISESEFAAARQQALSHSTSSNIDPRLVNNVARWHKEMGEWLMDADTVQVDVSPGGVGQSVPSSDHSLDRCPAGARSDLLQSTPKQTKKVRVVFSYQSHQLPFLQRQRQELNRSGIDTVDGTQVSRCCWGAARSLLESS